MPFVLAIPNDRCETDLRGREAEIHKLQFNINQLTIENQIIEREKKKYKNDLQKIETKVQQLEQRHNSIILCEIYFDEYIFHIFTITFELSHIVTVKLSQLPSTSSPASQIRN